MAHSHIYNENYTGADITDYACTIASRELRKCAYYRIARVEDLAWEVTCEPLTPTPEAPWGRYADKSIVKLAGTRRLLCDCGFYEMCLMSCCHIVIMTVKKGTVDKEDFHFRWYTTFDSKHITLGTHCVLLQHAS